MLKTLSGKEVKLTLFKNEKNTIPIFFTNNFAFSQYVYIKLTKYWKAVQIQSSTKCASFAIITLVIECSS